LEFHRYADGTMPAFGDRWLMGADMESLNVLPSRSFSIWCSSSNARSPHIYITPTGQTVIPFGSLSSPTIHTSTLNINGTNINQLYQSKEDMINYLKTSDFNSTSTSLVNTTNAQTINGEKTFSNTVLVRNGRGSIKVYPPNGQVGPATFHTYRYSDQAMPSQGDHWEFGQDLLSNIQGWEWLQRSFRYCIRRRWYS
jgi:hypothetical protein